jgi:hypothetical protein
LTFYTTVNFDGATLYLFFKQAMPIKLAPSATSGPPPAEHLKPLASDKMLMNNPAASDGVSYGKF